MMSPYSVTRLVQVLRPWARHGLSTRARIGFDYFYITICGAKVQTGLECADDAAREEARRICKIIKRIVLRCFESSMIFGHVPYKGAGKDQFVCGRVVAVIAWLGHTKLLLKADTEPALQALIEQSLEPARMDCQARFL